jgi:hypothetical protein
MSRRIVIGTTGAPRRSLHPRLGAPTPAAGVVWSSPKGGVYWDAWEWSEDADDAWWFATVPLYADVRRLLEDWPNHGIGTEVARGVGVIPLPSDPDGAKQFARIAASPDPMERVRVLEAAMAAGGFFTIAPHPTDPYRTNPKARMVTPEWIGKRWPRIVR